VEIASGAKHVIIPAGKTSSYGADGLLPESPEPSGKIELALDPPRTVPATKSVFLEGTVSGGPALVVVAGSPVSVGADNRFSLEVKAPAKGPFSAVATDLSGNKVTAAFGKAGPAKKPADKPPKKPNKPGKK
jgi:hypothetical protein